MLYCLLDNFTRASYSYACHFKLNGTVLTVHIAFNTIAPKHGMSFSAMTWLQLTSIRFYPSAWGEHINLQLRWYENTKFWQSKFIHYPWWFHKRIHWRFLHKITDISNFLRNKEENCPRNGCVTKLIRIYKSQ